MKLGVRVFAALFFASSIAGAAPFVDPMLTGQSGRLVVIAQIKDRAPVGRSTDSVRTYAQVRAALVQNARVSQQRVLQSLAAIDSVAKPIRVQPLWITNAIIVEINADQLPELIHHPDVQGVYANRPVDVIPGLNPRRIDRRVMAADPFTYGLNILEIPKLRTADPKMTGTGVKVGILDTGVDGTHPDLVGKIALFKDFVGTQTVPYDDAGHGTHVSGTIAGGATSGTAIGIAPSAKIVMGKIFDAAGSGSEATALLAMQWIADPDGNPATPDAPQLVSNSWGFFDTYSGQDPAQNSICQAVDAWVKLGIVPIFAAGNEGPSTETVRLPGACPSALTVGATDSNDALASFSSQGPAPWSTGALIKPVVSAPGVDVLSAKPGGQYQTMSGTSMATPHVAGMLALIYQAFPGISVDQATQIAIRGVKDLGARGQDNQFGWGRIDAFQSIKGH